MANQLKRLNDLVAHFEGRPRCEELLAEAIVRRDRYAEARARKKPIAVCRRASGSIFGLLPTLDLLRNSAKRFNVMRDNIRRVP